MDALPHEIPHIYGRGIRDHEGRRMELDLLVTGAIVDSWVEPGKSAGDGSRLVLQVAPSGRPADLMIVEAEASLVPDLGWLEDLRSNLCHGSPVEAVCRPTLAGLFCASKLHLDR